MSAEDYKKMLRNRISALKSRVKKKEEEKELQSLRRMKQRLLMCLDVIISKENYHAMIDMDDDSFKNMLESMKGADHQPQNM